MENNPEFPELIGGLPEELGLFALRLNTAEAYMAAKAQNTSYVAGAYANGYPTALRFVIREVVTATQPLTEQAVAATTDRFVVIPNSDLDTISSRLIVRVPTSQENSAVDGTLFDFFVERVTRHGERQRYLINELGVWRYNNAAELDQVAPGVFRVQGNSTPEDIETVTELSRELGYSKPDFDAQTSFGLNF
jgi:hypothetical protein